MAQLRQTQRFQPDSRDCSLDYPRRAWLGQQLQKHLAYLLPISSLFQMMQKRWIMPVLITKEELEVLLQFALDQVHSPP
jgi:hypothetical protein